jgi:hypothetical protein
MSDAAEQGCQKVAGRQSFFLRRRLTIGKGTMTDNPFDNIESAHRYLSLLGDAVAEARCNVNEDLEALGATGTRREEALKLVPTS